MLSFGSKLVWPWPYPTWSQLLAMVTATVADRPEVPPFAVSGTCPKAAFAEMGTFVLRMFPVLVALVVMRVLPSMLIVTLSDRAKPPPLTTVLFPGATNAGLAVRCGPLVVARTANLSWAPLMSDCPVDETASAVTLYVPPAAGTGYENFQPVDVVPGEASTAWFPTGPVTQR